MGEAEERRRKRRRRYDQEKEEEEEEEVEDEDEQSVPERRGIGEFVMRWVFAVDRISSNPVCVCVLRMVYSWLCIM